MRTVYLGIGSNLGDRKKNIQNALEELQGISESSIQSSSFYSSKAWGFDSDHLFLNVVVVLKTQMSALELLNKTQEIERKLGRTKKSEGNHYEDRIIDIDILIYGKEVIKTECLTVPHPLMEHRLFVLEPFNELAPRLRHPVLRKTIHKLYMELLQSE